VAVGVILLLTIVAAAIGHWLPDVWRAFSRGGWLTLGVIVLIPGWRSPEFRRVVH
jgi:hypothetical protein